MTLFNVLMIWLDFNALVVRCKATFRYFRRGRHRLFCEPCRDINRQEANDASNAEAKQARLEARENARLCHAG